VGSLLLIWMPQVTFARNGVRASRTLHDSLLATVLRARQSFFDATPAGRILNRFSQDVYTVDEVLPSTLASLLSTLASMLGTVAVISSVTPLFLAVVPVLLLIYGWIQRF